MPKIGPNKVSIDPKAYAARVTSAKKRVAQIDPATKAKLSEYYPKITEKDIAKQMLNPKTTLSDMAKRIKANPTATPKVKVIKKAAAKPTPKSGPMRRTTMADRIQDAKNVQPKGPAKPKTIGTGPNKAKVTPMSPAKKSEKGLPKTGRQNVKKAGK